MSQMGEPLQAQSLSAWPFVIDRRLNVPLGVQLRGQMEYGIAGGELPRGSRLPSVRELSHSLGLAHMTVAQVYKELLALNLIVTQPGRGTYVADAPQQASGPELGALRQLLAAALSRAEREGYSREQIGDVLNVLLARGWAEPSLSGVRVLLVGLFADTTRAYADELQGRLRPADRVQAVTLDELRLSDAPRADVVLALAHRLTETQSLLPGVSIIPVNFVPAPQVRADLAALPPRTRLAVVATFEAFLPTFLSGIGRFAPQLNVPGNIQPTYLHAPDLPAVLEGCDVAVYASGSEAVRLMANRPSFEYRHTIDPRDVQQLIWPAVEHCRAQAKETDS